MRTKDNQLYNKTPHDNIRTKVNIFCAMNKGNYQYNIDYID